jgi:hypothetical protein
MALRFFASVLVSALLVLSVGTLAVGTNAYAQTNDLWYPGEGVMQDRFYKYVIQEFDTNDEKPFEMTLYFQEQDEDGDWIVPTFVVDDDGSVVQGTFKLSDGMTYLSGGSTIPPEMNDYVGGYSGSLHWLDSFTTKAEPKSLSSANWGRTGSIGGSDVKPAAKETITVPAGTFDTTRIELRKGYTSMIWVQNDFPFPIKADFLTDTTSGAPGTQFKFELLETGSGKPEPPLSEENIPFPPLTEQTPRGDYTITLDWEPADPNGIPQGPVLFTVSLGDSDGFPLARANYDFVVRNSTGIVAEFINQNADVDLGTATHEVQFDGSGGMTATVTVNSVSGQTSGQFTESADFRLVVVPEFPVGAAIVVASVLGLIVVLARFKGTSMGGLFGGRNAV